MIESNTNPKCTYSSNRESNKTVSKLKAWILILLFPYISDVLGLFTFSSTQMVLYNSMVTSLFLIIFFLSLENHVVNFKGVIILVLYTLTQTTTVLVNGTIHSLLLLVLELICITTMMLVMPLQKIDRANLNNLFGFLIYLGIILCLLNIGLNHKTIFSFWHNGNAYSTASSSVFSNKNVWGQLLFPIAVINIYFLSAHFTIKYFFSLMIILYNVFASFSKTSMLVIVVFGVIYILMTNRGNFKRNFMLVLLGITALTIIFKIPSVRIYIDSYLFPHDLSFTGRTSLWTTGIESFKEHPILGVGMGKSEQILNFYSLSEFHNSYIEWLVAGGILKFAAFSFIILNSARATIKIYKRDYKLGAFFAGIINAVLVYCFFESFQLFGRSLNTVLITFIIVSLPFMVEKNMESFIN